MTGGSPHAGSILTINHSLLSCCLSPEPWNPRPLEPFSAMPPNESKSPPFVQIDFNLCGDDSKIIGNRRPPVKEEPAAGYLVLEIHRWIRYMNFLCLGRTTPAINPGDADGCRKLLGGQLHRKKMFLAGSHQPDQTGAAGVSRLLVRGAPVAGQRICRGIGPFSRRRSRPPAGPGKHAADPDRQQNQRSQPEYPFLLPGIRQAQRVGPTCGLSPP